MYYGDACWTIEMSKYGDLSRTFKNTKALFTKHVIAVRW